MPRTKIGTRVELYAYTRPVYSKTGELRIETTIRTIQRSNLTGRIVSQASAKFMNQRQASSFIHQFQSGELEGYKAMAILRSRSGKTHPNLVRSGARSIVQMFEDKIPVSDYNRDKLAYMMNQMDWQDFEKFYDENSDAVQKIYRVGSPRAHERDRNIVSVTDWERDNSVDDLLDRMQTFLNISDEEMDDNVNPQNYNRNGARKQGKSIPRFAQWLYS